MGRRNQRVKVRGGAVRASEPLHNSGQRKHHRQDKSVSGDTYPYERPRVGVRMNGGKIAAKRDTPQRLNSVQLAVEPAATKQQQQNVPPHLASMRSPTLRFSLHLSRMWSLGKLVVALGSDVSFVSTSSATVYASKGAFDKRHKSRAFATE